MAGEGREFTCPDKGYTTGEYTGITGEATIIPCTRGGGRESRKCTYHQHNVPTLNAEFDHNQSILYRVP